MIATERPLFYEFGDFRADAAKHVLWRDGEQISLTPKVFEMLLVFLEHPGEILDKELLMNLLWADSFVEESNLTQNVAVLRKALGENSKQHKYILTVPGRGYRFVADVSEVTANDQDFPKTENGHRRKVREKQSDELAHDQGVRSTNNFWLKRPVFLISVATTAIALAALFAFSWQSNLSPGRDAPILSARYGSELLSTDGKVTNPTISPDGKFVIYTHLEIDEMQSVWLRNLETGQNTEILPPSANFYYGLEFSPDGSLLYIARKPSNREMAADIYRVSIHGGIPQKIVGEAEGWMSISPDGSQIAFVRCNHRPDDNCSLWIADSIDGQNERKLLTRPQPYRFRDIDFSPDGKLIAFASGQSENQGMDFALSAFDLESGTERELTPERFFNITGLAWLPIQRSMLIAASKRPTERSHIWHVAMDTGEAELITKDSEAYRSLSIDRSGSSLIAEKYDQDFRIRVLDWENGSETLVLPKAGRLSFAPDGRLFFSSVASGNTEIWSVNRDGSGRRQLTDDPGDDQLPVIGPDNNSVYFASNRTGSIQVWRMNADGSSQTQLTRETGGFPISASPDGEWVYFYQGLDRSLWRASTRGSGETFVYKSKRKFAISPDGTRLAYRENIAGENFVVVILLSNGEKVDQLKIADQTGKLIQIAWLADGKGLAYILSKDDFRKNSVWLHTFDARDAPRKIVEIDQQISEGNGFAVAPDGKSFAVSQGDWLHDAVLIKGFK